jgi:hypothetical protein
LWREKPNSFHVRENCWAFLFGAGYSSDEEEVTVSDETGALNTSLEGSGSSTGGGTGVAESPAAESTTAGLQSGTDAGDTGDTGAAGGERVDGFGDYGDSDEGAESSESAQEKPGPIPYARFKEVLDQAKQLPDAMKRIGAFEQLVSNPDVARAAYKAAYGRELEEVEQSSEPEYMPLQLPPGYEFSDLGLGEQLLFQQQEDIHRQQWELSQQLRQFQGAYQQQSMARQREERQAVEQQVNLQIGSLESGRGVKLSKAQRDEMVIMGAKLLEAHKIIGRPLTNEQALAQAFEMVAKPQMQKQQQVTGQKQNIAQGRPGNVPGPSVAPANRSYAKPRDGYEEAFREAFPNGLSRG